MALAVPAALALLGVPLPGPLPAAVLASAAALGLAGYYYAFVKGTDSLAAWYRDEGLDLAALLYATIVLASIGLVIHYVALGELVGRLRRR